MDRYPYTECGLDGVWLLDGFEHIDTGYGEAVHIENVEGLHRAIGEHVARLDRPLIEAEMRFLRKSMDLPQRELAELPGLSDAVTSKGTGPTEPLLLELEANGHGWRTLAADRDGRHA